MRSLKRELQKLRRGSLLGTSRALFRYPFVLRKRARYRRMLQLGDRKDRFGEIYSGGLWHSSESGSGQGSELSYTENIRRWLPELIDTYDVTTITDAACGDFNWMRHVLSEVEVRYFGLDIVEAVISRNIEAYSDARTRFATADICTDPLPACDLLIIRDCLFHLSFCDVDRILRNIAELDYSYLLTNTHFVEEDFSNSDIETGDFHLIDLYSPPFGFDPCKVVERIEDFPRGYPIPREMVMFRKRDVPDRLCGT